MNDLQKKPSADLSTPIEELEYQLLYGTDMREMENVINLFNLNIQKKNIVRTGKMSDVQDAICEQIKKRVDSKPDEFSNKDLLDYYKTIQDSLTKADTTLDKVPTVEINQGPITINVTDQPQLSSVGKLRVMEFVKQALAESQKTEDIIDVTNEANDDIVSETNFTDIIEKEEEK